MSATNAALYLRSSKDRSDVSIAAQRHELEALARNRDLAILDTYEDVVESGASEDRPAFLELISALRNPPPWVVSPTGLRHVSNRATPPHRPSVQA